MATETLVKDRVDLEVMTLQVVRELSEFAMRASVVDLREPTIRSMVIALNQKVASQVLHDEEVRYPSDWWQAFRSRWFPRWYLRRWPVRETVVRIEACALYPKIALPEQRWAAYQVYSVRSVP